METTIDSGLSLGKRNQECVRFQTSQPSQSGITKQGKIVCVENFREKTGKQLNESSVH